MNRWQIISIVGDSTGCENGETRYEGGYNDAKRLYDKKVAALENEILKDYRSSSWWVADTNIEDGVYYGYELVEVDEDGNWLATAASMTADWKSVIEDYQEEQRMQSLAIRGEER